MKGTVHKRKMSAISIAIMFVNHGVTLWIGEKLWPGFKK